MRFLLLALPFALLPGFALGAEHHDHGHAQHNSLAAHEHGAAELDAALDGSTLEIELRSPAMNLVGFEHAPGNEAERRKITNAHDQLEIPDPLLGLPAAAGCTLATTELEGALFEDHADAHPDDHDSGHSEIHAHYQFDCATPQALTEINLQGWFKAFPGAEKIQAQLIGPNGQRGAQLSQGQPRAEF